MRSMAAHQSGGVSGYLVGDPAAARHGSGLRSWVSEKAHSLSDKGKKIESET